MSRSRTGLLILTIAALGGSVAVAKDVPAEPSAIATVLRNAEYRVVTRVSEVHGSFNFVRAERGSYLDRDGGKGGDEARARSFLKQFGELVGMSAGERAGRAGSRLTLLRVDTDPAGRRHVRFTQSFEGTPVFGAQIIVHMDDHGITAINGDFIPGVKGSPKPAVVAADARRIAVETLSKQTRRADLRIESMSVQWYHLGLISGQPGNVVAAYEIKVSGTEEGRTQVWIDAATGYVINQIPLMSSARNRLVYSPQYDRRNPDRFVVRKEGDPDTYVPPVDNLYRFSGQVYNWFANGFDRDSYDAKGETMRTVALVNNICPNAYWNGSSTNYCPGFDLDDVVAHEWGHAYTEYTHGLIYQCQSGALNESYSDIWGEAIDLTNGEDGVGGSVNDKPYPDGERWLVGEDLGDAAQEAILRDMWDPERLGDPSKVSSAAYVCANDNDNGGVHYNSGIPNLAFAMLVDGKTFNGKTVQPIGLVRASQLYYQAQLAYQTPASKFADHQQALLASCSDLQGVNLKDPLTGAASNQPISNDTCTQVANATDAVEMGKQPPGCQFGPMLKPGAPAMCPGATTIFSEDFEDGLAEWTPVSIGAGPEWPGHHWTTTTRRVRNKPASAPTLAEGNVAYAEDSNLGSCEAGNDTAGQFSITSKMIRLPKDANAPRLRFDHYLATERADGGNVMISVNGGDFAVVPNSAFLFNPPQSVIPETLPGGSGTGNPKGAEPGWLGSDGGEVTGSWGTSVIDLDAVANPGDTVAIRFDMGLDCGGGTDGWYIDNVVVYDCPLLAPPTNVHFGRLAGGKPFHVWWERPAGAVGPDFVQESSVACAPLLRDDAENGFALWEPSVTGTGAQSWSSSGQKPEHDSTTFFVRGLPGTTNTSSLLTLKEPITIGTGITTLTFKDWHANEGDDQMLIEVSADAGTTWKPVYNNSRSDYIPFALAAHQSEPMVSRSADLSAYAGKRVLLRLHYKLGPDDRIASGPIGWYVDDLEVRTDSWKTAGRSSARTRTLRVEQHAASTSLCYRVATTYRVSGKAVRGLWSAPSPKISIAKVGR